MNDEYCKKCNLKKWFCDLFSEDVCADCELVTRENEEEPEE